MRQHKETLLAGLLIILLTLLVLSSIGRVVYSIIFTNETGDDFHSYWYSGLFIRQNTDPFVAYLAHKTPQLPISHLTGQTTDFSQTADLQHTPANTAPVVLLLSLFSWLPWQSAKIIWFLINLILLILIPLLLIYFLTPHPPMPKTAVLISCLIFYALMATRPALATGQTTILVLTFIIFSLIFEEKSWLVAGIFLGLALSKYSITLPIFLYFLGKKQFKILATSLVIQFLGILIISGISSSTLWSIIQSYYQIMLVHINQSGIHLAELFATNSVMRTVGPILLTVIVIALFLRQYLHHQSNLTTVRSDKFINLHILAILSLWTLLVAYHRAYDGLILIFFIVMIMYGLTWPERWQLSANQRTSVGVYFAGAMIILFMPYNIISALIPGQIIQYLLWGMVKIVILTLVSMLGVTFWLWKKASDENGR